MMPQSSLHRFVRDQLLPLIEKAVSVGVSYPMLAIDHKNGDVEGMEIVAVKIVDSDDHDEALSVVCADWLPFELNIELQNGVSLYAVREANEYIGHDLYRVELFVDCVSKTSFEVEMDVKTGIYSTSDFRNFEDCDTTPIFGAIHKEFQSKVSPLVD